MYISRVRMDSAADGTSTRILFDLCINHVGPRHEKKKRSYS